MILLKEEKEVLLHYINLFPSRWKSKIKSDWEGRCHPALRHIRNTYGPSWIMALTADKVRNSKIQGG